MKRVDLFRKIRSDIREYRRARPAWHQKSVSEWLLTLMQINTVFLTQGNWAQQGREHYFYRLLSVVVLCMDDNGLITPGVGPPIERRVPRDESSLDLVLLAIDRGCAKYAGKSATDWAIMINYHLSRAIETQPTDGNTAYTLEEIRDIASLAILGLEMTKLNGDFNAEAN